MRLAGVRSARRITGLPFHLRVALGIGVAELQIGDLHGNARTRHRPLRIGRELRQRDQRVVKNAGQIQRAIVDQQLGFATSFGQIKISG